MKKIIKALAVMLLATSMISPVSFAKNDQAKESLVALGDSIPFGYNLGKTNKNPSKLAYPYLIGAEENLRVRNLAEPGMQSYQLLDALRNDQKYRQAVRHSDYVVISIGSNDLLQIAQEAWAATLNGEGGFQSLLTQKLDGSPVFNNISLALRETRLLTDSPIVIYNLYNPFYSYYEQLYPLANQVLPIIDYRFSELENPSNKIYIAYASTAIAKDPALYLIDGDIHPSAAGQQKLADIGISAFGLNSKTYSEVKSK